MSTPRRRERISPQIRSLPNSDLAALLMKYMAFFENKSKLSTNFGMEMGGFNS